MTGLAGTHEAPPTNGDAFIALFGDRSVVSGALALDPVFGTQVAEQSRFVLTPGPWSWGAAATLLRNAAAIRLLQGWLADDSGYDEEVWPDVKDAIEANRMSSRARFHG